MTAFGSVGVTCRAYLTMLSNPSDTTLAELERGVQTWRNTASKVSTPWCLDLLAQAQGALGRPEQGLKTIDESIAITEQTGEQLYLSGVLLTKADLLLSGSTPDEAGAEATLDQAMRVSRTMNARHSQLRAATRLARLWHGQGKPKQGLELLTRYLEPFSEGLDAPAVLEASRLAEKLEPTHQHVVAWDSAALD